MSKIEKLYVGTSGEIMDGQLYDPVIMVWLDRPEKTERNGVVCFEDGEDNHGVFVEFFREINPQGGGYEMPISLKPVRGWQEILIEEPDEFSMRALMDGKEIVKEWSACERAALDLPRHFWAPVNLVLSKLCVWELP